MTLLVELVKMLRQIFGQGNMFGYKSTLANQLFLLYCFFGKIYFTDKIHPQMKFFWLLYHLSGLLLGYVLGIAFLFYDAKKDILMELYVLNYIGNSTFMGILLPLASYRYSDQIEAVIRGIDEIRSRYESSSEWQTQSRKLKYKVWLHIIGIYTCCAICAFATLLDVIIFYDDEKVRDYTYYIIPFPAIERYGNMRFFLITTIFSIVIVSAISIETISVCAFLFAWGFECHYQNRRIGDRLIMTTVALDRLVENSAGNVYVRFKDTDARLRHVLMEAIREFKENTRLIKKLTEFYEIICSFVLPAAVIDGIVQIYSIVSTDLPIAVKIKCTGSTMAVGWIALVICLTGQTLENSVFQISFAVYSTPWYWSVNLRKEIYLFLCQTQRDVNLRAMKVFPMVSRTFARFSHLVLSSVNFLHQVTQK